MEARMWENKTSLLIAGTATLMGIFGTVFLSSYLPQAPGFAMGAGVVFIVQLSWRVIFYVGLAQARQADAAGVKWPVGKEEVGEVSP